MRKKKTDSSGFWDGFYITLFDSIRFSSKLTKFVLVVTVIQVARVENLLGVLSYSMFSRQLYRI